MFKVLPYHLQQQVLKYLAANDFRSAKAVYDRWKVELDSANQS